MTDQQLQDMRDWVADCTWGEGDNDPDEQQEWIAAMDDETLLRGIERHYAGGIAQFLADGVPA